MVNLRRMVRLPVFWGFVGEVSGWGQSATWRCPFVLDVLIDQLRFIDNNNPNPHQSPLSRRASRCGAACGCTTPSRASSPTRHGALAAKQRRIDACTPPSLIHTPITTTTPPRRAALLLEDAYQYLQWYLASKPHLRTQHARHAKPVAPRRPAAALPSGKKRPKKQQQREGGGKEEDEEDEDEEEEEEIGVEDAGGVLLTVQVDGIDGDQLVQFRSLQVRSIASFFHV